MKSFANLKQLIAIVLIANSLMMGNSILNAQESTLELKDFKITIEKNDNEIILKCDKGCAWIDLTYENRREVQAINEFGMTELKEDQLRQDDNLSDFLFTLSKTKDGVSLKGIKGTAWVELGFTLSEGQKQMIDQYGMTREK